MRVNFNMTAAVIVALAVIAQAHVVRADLTVPLDPSGWVFHNQSGTVGGTLNSPTFTPADNSATVMAPFASGVQLLNDGDFVMVSLTLQLGTRAGDSVAAGSLNTQLRIGLFSGPAGAIGAGDSNSGIFAQYFNTGGAVQEASTAQANPFQNPLAPNVGSGGADSGGDSLRGTTVGDVLFQLALTRNSGKYDVSGQISGTDSSDGDAYLSTINLTGYTPQTLGFAINRVGFFFGPRVDGDFTTTNANFTAVLNGVTVTTIVAAIPESRFGMLAVALAMGAVMTGLKVRRAWQRRGQPQP